MRLRSPAEFYLKYLLVHPDAYTDEDIKERLLDENLDFISPEYVARLRRKLKPPKPFFPDDTSHTPSSLFIIREKINRMFQPDQATKIARKLLEAPRAREFVESMLLAHAPLASISQFITRHRNFYCTTAALEAYSHYFWNIELLDSTQMRVLLNLRVERSAEQAEFKDKKKLLERAYYKDPRKVAADLPYSRASAMIAQMRMGIMPARMELAVNMMEARNNAFVRAIEASQQDGPGDSQKFLNYCNGGRVLEELLQIVVKPEDQLRDDLRAIVLRTETRPLPSIHQLSAGQHTVDVTPVKEPDEQSVFEPETGDGIGEG